MAAETFRNALSLKDYGFSSDSSLGLLMLKPIVPGRRELRLTCGPASFEGWVSIFSTFAKAAVQRTQATIRSGWLERKGKKRWVVLYDDELYWFRHEVPLENSDLRRMCSGHVSLLYATIHAQANQISISSAQGDRVLSLSGKPNELSDWATAIAEAEERARMAHEKWVREHPALFHIEHRGYLVKNERPLFFVVQMGRLSWFMTDKRTLLSDDEIPPSKYTNKERFSTPLPATTDESIKAVLSQLVTPSDYIRPELPADSMTAPPLNEAALPFKLEDPHLFVPYYKLYFADRPHYNFIGKDPDGNPIIVSLQKRRSPGKRVKALIRTRRENERRELALGREKLSGLLAELGDVAATWSLQRCSTPELEAALVSWEDRLIVRTYKFGVIYQRAGQTDEDALYNNRETSAAYEEFLLWLGTRVKLQGWDKFRGGLNVRDNSTGEFSVYSTVGTTELMFHVATLIPYHANDAQQVERKRHLGNDVCMVVFRDPDVAGPIDLTIFKSQFNHVFAVIQPDAGSSRYRMTFSHKLGVAEHGPFLPAQKNYDRSEVLRQLLLSKLINGERAAMYAPDFKGKMSSTRKQTLLDLIATHPPDPAPASPAQSEGSLQLSKKLMSQGFDKAAETAEAAKHVGNKVKGTLGKLLKTSSVLSSNSSSAAATSSSATSAPPSSSASAPATAPASSSTAPAPSPAPSNPSSSSGNSSASSAAATTSPPATRPPVAKHSSATALGLAPSPTTPPTDAATPPVATTYTTGSHRGHQRTPSTSKPLPKAPSRRDPPPSPEPTTGTTPPASGSSPAASVDNPADAGAVAARAGWKPYVSKTVRGSSDAGRRAVLWVGGSRADMEAVARQIKDPSLQLIPLATTTALRDWLAASGELYPVSAVRVVTNRCRPNDGGDSAAEQLVGLLRADPRWREVDVLVLCGEPAKVTNLRSPVTRITSDMSEALQFASFAEPATPAAPVAPAPVAAVVTPTAEPDHKPPSKPLPKGGSRIGSNGGGRSSSPSSNSSAASSAPATATATPAATTAPSASPSVATPAPVAPPAKKPRRVKALWAFQGAQPGDLSFVAGDIITVLGEVEQWLEGEVRGVTGIFPSNYVTELVE